MLPHLLIVAVSLGAGPVGKKPVRPKPPAAAKADDAAADEEKADGNARREAGAHFKRGVTFYKEGNFQAALTEFKSAYELVPSYEVLFNLALCERRLFHYGPAMRTLTQYLMEGGERIPAERREAVAREVEAIRALTSPVAVIVDGAPATVLVDDEPVGTTPFSELLLLGIGKHKVRAEREGCTPDERVIEVKSGQAQSVQLSPASLTEPMPVEVGCVTPGARVSADGAAPVACPATLTLPPGTHELVASAPGFVSARTEVLVEPGKPRRVTIAELAVRARPFPTLGVSLLGGGVALGGAGLAFALMASANATRTADTVRAGGPWDAAAVSNEQAGVRNSALAWTFLGLGAGALAAGVITLALQLSGQPSAGVALLLPTPGGLVACGTF
ncbi:MAG: PEGA domain-containing protein [Myxococcota bacterium]